MVCIQFFSLLDPETTYSPILCKVKRGKLLRTCLFFSPVDLLQNYLLPKALPWLLLVDCLFYNNLGHTVLFLKKNRCNSFSRHTTQTQMSFLLLSVSYFDSSILCRDRHV